MTTVDFGGGITLTRLHFEGNTPSFTSSGLTDTIVWEVNATPVYVVLQNVVSAVGAVRGELHPDFSDLIVNTVSVVATGHGSKVTVAYGSQSTFDLDQPEPEAEGYIDIDTTFGNEDIEIPIYQKVTKTFGDLISMDVFQRVSNSVGFRFTKSVNRVVLNADIATDGSVTTQLDIAKYLNEQNNKLHKIGGVWYLFEVDGVRPIGKTRYQFTYRWTYDPGVPNTLNLPLDDQFAVQGSYLYPIAWQPGDDANEFIPDTTKSWIVVPHHRTDVATATGDPTQLPLVNLAPQYLVGSAPGGNGNGYLLLPGVTA